MSATETIAHRFAAIQLEFVIPEVSKQVYRDVHRAVEEAIPDVFFVTIRPVSIEQLLAEDLTLGRRRFNHIWSDKISPTVMTAVPKEMEVFIDPMAVRIEGSNCKSSDEQRAMIAREEVRLRAQLPEGVRHLIHLLMPHPSTLVQVENKYINTGGALLLPDFLARTDAETSRDCTTIVGRSDPRRLRQVNNFRPDDSASLVFAVPVGVLPRYLQR